MIKGLYEAHLPVSDMQKSVYFYQNLGLEVAQLGEGVSFLWIEKCKSWLGLWRSEHTQTPYHPSIRHLAFYIDLESMLKAQAWLKEKEIEVREDFGISPERQPLILRNGLNFHAAIYFLDPDGNSLELITPLEVDAKDTDINAKTLQEWMSQRNCRYQQ